jgi:hypothetical protein
LSSLLDWQPGQIVRERYPLTLDPAATSGRYRLRLTLVNGKGAFVVIGSVPVEARQRRYRLPRVPHTLDAHLGDAVVLKGYDLAPEQPVAGGELAVTLYWQTTGRLSTSYKTFVHLLDAAGTLRAQVDDFPLSGEAPTDSWLPGEALVDRYWLALPPDLSAGAYRLVVGLYDPISGQRLPAVDASGQSFPANAVSLQEVGILR